MNPEQDIALPTNTPATVEPSEEIADCYYNIMDPTNKIQCDRCAKDISKTTKILTQGNDYCVGCFAKFQKFEDYQVINKLDFPIFEKNWTAEEELLMLSCLEKHGYGNWGQVSNITNKKSADQVQRHFYSICVDNPTREPSFTVISRRDQTGNIVISEKLSKQQTRNKETSANKDINLSISVFQRANLAGSQTNSALKTGANPAEVVGFMPKRGDFDIEYDNDAELLLAEMEFYENDSEEERNKKFCLMDIYNQKLNERILRKQFVISRKLLDLKEQTRLQKTRTKEQKQIHNMMKVFARFNSPDSHERLVNGIIKQKQIRQRIEELKELKKKGLKTLEEVENQLQNKKKKDQKGRRQPPSYLGLADKNKTRRSRKDLLVDKNEKKTVFLSKDEQDLCQRLNMTFKQYLGIKQSIIKQSVRLGIIDREETIKSFSVGSHIIGAVFDFLVEKEDIFTRAQNNQMEIENMFIENQFL